MNNKKPIGQKNNSRIKWDHNNPEHLETLEKIIKKGNVKFLNEFCYKLGEEYVKEKLSTSQIRNIFNEVQDMKEYDEVKLQLLRPKLAYIAGRHQKTTPVIKEHLQPMLDAAIEMTDKDTFKNFKNFLEAIVAYHRYHCEKDI